jgi:dTMP kinase
MAERAGRFITLEGIDGCGKTSQAGFLSTRLRCEGKEVTSTREPGGTIVGGLIRSVLLDNATHLEAESELLLFLAARADHVRKVIVPALDDGAIVVCDRFSDSTFAYQGYGRGMDLDFIRKANEFATGGLQPDLTIQLVVPVELSLERQRQRNRMELEPLQFHFRVAAGFTRLAGENPGRIVTVDGTGDVYEVAGRIADVVREFGIL